MYCVKCGVKLKDGVNVCPLCHTKMQYEEKAKKNASYSDVLPNKVNPFIGTAAIMSVIFMAACLTIMVTCINLYSKLSWGGYVIASLILFYIVAILPLWFIKRPVIWYVLIDIASIELFLLYICLKTNGHWFLSFAFPIVLLMGILLVIIVVTYKYIKKAGFFIYGGLAILFGLFSMLIEMFEVITFHTKMYSWCLYVLICMSLVGIFLILCGLIRPLRNSIEKRFFM